MGLYKEEESLSVIEDALLLQLHNTYIIALYVISSSQGGATFDLAALSGLQMSSTTQNLLFLGFFIAFAIKAPLWPLHTWLPDAADSATPGTSVLLLGVLDKVGTFGMIRYCLTLFPEASKTFTPVILVLAVISILYGAILAIGQRDLKRLIAIIGAIAIFSRRFRSLRFSFPGVVGPCRAF